MFGGRVCQQKVCIPMGANCAPLLPDLFPLFVWDFAGSQEKRKKASLNLKFRYIDDVFSLNNSRLGDRVDRIYAIELEIKNTTDTDRSDSYLDLHLEVGSEVRLRTKLYDKRDDFNFPIVNFPFICSNIPAEYISLSWSDITEIMVLIRISFI
jgi:hypothetical protein